MIAFSGFSSRLLESQYNTCIEKMLYLLQTKIKKIDRQVEVDEKKFRQYFYNIYTNILKLEQSKYQPPRFGDCIKELAESYGFKSIQYSYPETIWEENVNSSSLNNYTQQDEINTKNKQSFKITDRTPPRNNSNKNRFSPLNIQQTTSPALFQKNTERINIVNSTTPEKQRRQMPSPYVRSLRQNQIIIKPIQIARNINFDTQENTVSSQKNSPRIIESGTGTEDEIQSQRNFFENMKSKRNNIHQTKLDKLAKLYKNNNNSNRNNKSLIDSSHIKEIDKNQNENNYKQMLKTEIEDTKIFFEEKKENQQYDKNNNTYNDKDDQYQIQDNKIQQNQDLQD